MKEIKVVIGKNFGDEGKGATVHRLCMGKEAIVVRHNGGAQAGHTVEDGDFRFVFHQLGSGSLLGCHTFWSKTFLPDLLKLDEEVEGFLAEVKRANDMRAWSGDLCQTDTGNRNEGVKQSVPKPRIYAHPECACTVIYDVLINSLTEVLRGSAKHGSCGMGIYEATLRVKEEIYTLRLKDFAVGNVSDIVRKLHTIREEYAMPRLQKLQEEYGDAFCGFEINQWVELIKDENVLWNAAEQMYENFHRYVELSEWQWVKATYDTIVFENAQGLMLDMDNREYYPHLTPSHTGLHNVIALFEEEAQGIQKNTNSLEPKLLNSQSKQELYTLEIAYVTRSYVTRHGMGRLDNECAKEAINPHMIDRTNVPNFWQDTLRYAMHPVGEEFWKYIRRDLKGLEGKNCFTKIIPKIYVNHLDETNGKILFADREMEVTEFVEFCKEQGMEVVYCEV